LTHVEATWHAFVAKLEEIRHHADTSLHSDLDTLSLHAAALKTEADKAAATAVAEASTTVPPLLEGVAKVVGEDALKAAQSEVKP
jgi:hypothetical protein